MTDPKGLLLIEGRIAIIPKGMQMEMVKDVHDSTHGSYKKIKETVGGSMI